MKILGMESTIKIGTNSEKKVSELVNETGYIMSLIKEGYIFDDEVLSAAHITRTIRNVRFEHIVTDKSAEQMPKLRKDSVSAKQIISELNSISKSSEDFKDNGGDDYENQIDNYKFEDNEE